MDFALINSEEISTEDAFARVRSLSKSQRMMFDIERYRTLNGSPLGTKKALMWMDIIQGVHNCYDKLNTSHVTVLERIANKFRDETTRRLAVEMIRKSNEFKI